MWKYENPGKMDLPMKQLNYNDNSKAESPLCNGLLDLCKFELFHVFIFQWIYREIINNLVHVYYYLYIGKYSTIRCIKFNYINII